MKTFDWKDYTLVATSLAITCGIGIYHGVYKSSNTLSDYLFGRNNMSIIPISLSLMASFISTAALIGASTESYGHGTQFLIGKLFAFTAMVTILILFYVPLYHRLKLNSLFQYLELRFDRKVKLLSSTVFVLARVKIIFMRFLIIIFSQLSYIPTIIYGTSVSINRATGIDIFIQNTILMLTCVFYTALGGFKGVVWSDVLQTFLMFISVVIMFVVGLIKIDGFSNMINTSLKGNRIEFFNMDPDPTLRTSFWLTFFGMFFVMSSAFSFNPEGYQRIISVDSEKKAKMAIAIYYIGSNIFSCIFASLGLIAYTYYFHCDPYTSGMISSMDQIVLHFVMDIADTGSVFGGLPGIFLLALVCVSLSTVSTFLNATAGTIYTDLMEPYISVSEINASRIVKLNVVILGVISLGLTPFFEHLGNLNDILISFASIFTGVNCGLFYIASFLPFVNAKGAFYGGLTGIAITMWIGIGSLSAKFKGLIRYEMLALNTDACDVNTTLITNTWHQAANVTNSYVFPVYRLSNYSFGLIGCVVVVLVSVIISVSTGCNKNVKLDDKLFADPIRRYISKGEYMGVKTEDMSL